MVSDLTPRPGGNAASSLLSSCPPFFFFFFFFGVALFLRHQEKKGRSGKKSPLRVNPTSQDFHCYSGLSLSAYAIRIQTPESERGCRSASGPIHLSDWSVPTTARRAIA